MPPRSEVIPFLNLLDRLRPQDPTMELLPFIYRSLVLHAHFELGQVEHLVELIVLLGHSFILAHEIGHLPLFKVFSHHNWDVGLLQPEFFFRRFAEHESVEYFLAFLVWTFLVIL